MRVEEDHPLSKKLVPGDRIIKINNKCLDKISFETVESFLFKKTGKLYILVQTGKTMSEIKPLRLAPNQEGIIIFLFKNVFQVLLCF